MGIKLKKLAVYATRLGGLLILSLIIASGIGLWQRISIAEWLVLQALQRSGFENVQFSIVDFGWRGLKVSEFELVDDGWRLAGERLDIDFSLGGLWEGGTVDEVVLRNGTLVIEVDSYLREMPDESLKRGAAYYWDEVFPFPVDRVVVENLGLVASMPGIPESLVMNLELKEGRSHTPEIELHLKNEVINLELDALVDAENRKADLSASVELADPLALLDVLNSFFQDEGLSERLAGFSVDGIRSTFDAAIDLHGFSSVTGSFDVTNGLMESSDVTISTEWLWGQYSVVDNQLTSIEGEGALAGAQLNYLTLSPARFSFALRGSDLRVFELRSDHVEWSYDDDTGGIASFQAEGRIADEIEKSEMVFEVGTIEQKVSGFSLQPFDLSAKGVLSDMEGTSSVIRMKNYPLIGLNDVSFSVSGILEGITTVDFSGYAISNEEEMSQGRMSPLKISGNAVIDDESICWKSSLEAQDSVLLRNDEEILEGAFSSLFSGSYEFETDLIDSEVTFRSSGLTGKWNEARFEGLNAKGVINIEELNTENLSSIRENGVMPIVEKIWPLTTSSAELAGNEISLQDSRSAKWFSLNLEKERSEDPADESELTFAWNAGIAELGPETIQQLALTGSIFAMEGVFEYEGKIAGLLEGEEAKGRFSGEADLRDEEQFEARGAFEFEPIRFVSSDIVSRHFPRLNGVSASGLIETEGTYWWNQETSDARIRLTLDSGRIAHPAQDLRIEGVSILADIASVSEIKGSGVQRVDVESIRYGDTVGKNLKARFSLEGIDKLRVEQVAIELYEGMVSVEPMELSLTSLDVDFRIRFDELSVTPIMEKIDFFDGIVIGKVSGSLPISMRHGAIEMGEGFLELTECTEARLLYNAEGLFAEQETPKGIYKKMVHKAIGKLGLNPETVVEDSLADLPIDQLRIDLFNKSLPDTPIRARIIGTADTGKVQAPVDLTVNVKGTMEELLNFLMQMGSL